MGAGIPLYTDDLCAWRTLFSVVRGQEFIRTANADCGATEPDFLTFTLTADTTVYVAYEEYVTLPAWLSDWEHTGYRLYATCGTRRLYRKDFAAGTVTLGGACADCNYNVIAIGRR